MEYLFLNLFFTFKIYFIVAIKCPFMNQASFTIRKSKLKSELAKVTKAFRGLSVKKYSTVLEITITDDLLTLVVPGIKLEISCKTESTVKASLDFFYFFEIIKEWKGPTIHCIIVENEMHFGITKIKVQTTFFKDDSILKSIKLPVNYTDYHLLYLDTKNYTIEEIRFNGLEYLIFCAKRNLANNVKKAREILAVYGVTNQDIEELIERKIKLEL